MTRILSAAPLCTPNAPVHEFLEAAMSAGFDHVGIRLKEPQPSGALHACMETAQTRRALIQQVRDLKLNVLEVEAFWINEDFNIDTFRACLDVAAELQPTFLLVVGNDSNFERLKDNFNRTVELGREAGMRTVVEFIPYTAITSIADAQALINASGTDSGQLIDTLHVSRSGGSAEDLAIVPKGDLCMFHICDAPKMIPATLEEKRAEARGNRLAPGMGSLPLRQIIDMGPPDTPVEVECPVQAFAGMPPREIMTRLRQATLDCLA